MNAKTSFDVLKYADAANPRGIPPEWPALQETAAARGAPWVEMTAEELDAYRAKHRSTYDTWRAANPPVSKEAVPTRIIGTDGSVWQINRLGVLVKL